MNIGPPITLKEIIVELETYAEKYTTCIGELIQSDSQRIRSVDLLALPVLNRSTRLVSGFLSLIENQNYLCAIPLIRLQLDNSIRFYSTYLVNDPGALILEFLKGTPITKMKDRSNQTMSDSYLASELDKLFPGVKKIYRDTSGFIHLSDKHFYSTIDQSTENAGRMAFGDGPDLFTYPEQVNFVNQMVQTSELVLKVIESWKLYKQSQSM